MISFPSWHFIPDESYIWNGTKVDTPINGEASLDHHSPNANLDTCLHKHKFAFSATLIPEENTPIMRTNSLVKNLCCPFYWAPRCLAVNATYIIGLSAYRPTAWSQCWINLCPSLNQNCGASSQRRSCARRVAFIFWCLWAISVKHWWSLGVVAHLQLCSGLSNAFPVSEKTSAFHRNHTFWNGSGLYYFGLCLLFL